MQKISIKLFQGIPITSALVAMRGDEPVAEPEEVQAPPKARLVRFSKANNTFGFEVHSEQDSYGGSQYLRNIAADGPAKAAGVLEEDRIIEINSTPTGNKEHEDVVDMIRATGNIITFLLADSACSNYYHTRVS